MTFSSAYLFARQITAGNPSLPSNVIFDSGQFNSQRMKAGFSLNNILTAQSVYSDISYNNGRMAIEMGGFTQYIQAADGKTFESIGTANSTLLNTGQYLEHIGTSANDESIDGCAIYLPVEMDSLDEEGYSTIHVLLDWSTEGIVSPELLNTGEIATIVKKTENDYKLNNIGGGVLSLGNTPTLTEYEFNESLGGSGLGWVPSYIEIRVTHGTYHIKKIWFE